MLLKDILPVLCGPATLCEETEDHAHFRDLFSGYTREIPEELLHLPRLCEQPFREGVLGGSAAQCGERSVFPYPLLQRSRRH